MLPAFLLTVRTPSATAHCAGDPSCADTHSFWLLPSNRTIASEGAEPLVPGVTTFGSGLQTSVSSGFGFCWAKGNATEATKKIRMLSTRLRIRSLLRLFDTWGLSPFLGTGDSPHGFALDDVDLQFRVGG